VEVIENPAERVAEEMGFSFDKFMSRRLFWRAPEKEIDLVEKTLSKMSEGSGDIVLVNESPLSFLGYLGFHGMMARLTIQERDNQIRQIVDVSMMKGARHLFVQPWNEEKLQKALNVMIIPYLNLAGKRGKLVPRQKDYSETVKEATMKGLNLLGIKGVE
jgi:hypothetical protein